MHMGTVQAMFQDSLQSLGSILFLTVGPVLPSSAAVQDDTFAEVQVGHSFPYKACGRNHWHHMYIECKMCCLVLAMWSILRLLMCFYNDDTRK
jgi:hypothetical protein